jgi:hypothetical protein
MSVWKNLDVGMKVYSPYFNDEITIVKINSDTDWYFEIQGWIMKAKTPLRHFEKQINRADDIRPEKNV